MRKIIQITKNKKELFHFIPDVLKLDGKLEYEFERRGYIAFVFEVEDNLNIFQKTLENILFQKNKIRKYFLKKDMNKIAKIILKKHRAKELGS